MQELETLLNSLIKMDWKAKDRDVVSIKLDQEFTKSEWKTVFYCNCKYWFWFYADLRWLVSLESGLWQFCDKNWLLHKYCNWRSSIYPYIWYWTTTYEYRLLESALIPEEELAKFLIENIVVEWLKSEQSKK